MNKTSPPAWNDDMTFQYLFWFTWMVAFERPGWICLKILKMYPHHSFNAGILSSHPSTWDTKARGGIVPIRICRLLTACHQRRITANLRKGDALLGHPCQLSRQWRKIGIHNWQIIDFDHFGCFNVQSSFFKTRRILTTWAVNKEPLFSQALWGTYTHLTPPSSKTALTNIGQLHQEIQASSSKIC